MNETFTALPSEGTLEPHGSTSITFSFTPPEPITPVHDDLDHTFTNTMIVEVVETGQKLEFSMVGRAVNNYLFFSSYDFVFDKCEIGAKQSKELVIKNASKFLPIQFEVKPIAHFRFEPSKGKIKPSSEQKISVIFFPKNYGEFNFTTKVSICNGLITKEINLTAECGQITDKPFERVPIWETEENARYSAYHPDRRFSNGIEGIERASRLRERFDGFITEYAEARENRSQLQSMREKLRKDAEQYLSATLGQYTESVPQFRKSVDKMDPFGFYLKSHQSFIVTDRDLEFPSENSVQTLNVDFTPISLGTYRCLLLFQDKNLGEFLVEIVAKSTLPQPIEVGQNKLKIEATKKANWNFTVDIMNQNLIKALAYSVEKLQNAMSFVSERKFKELLTRRTHEIELLFKQTFQLQKFNVTNSSAQYFEMPNEVTIYKPNITEGKNQNPNILPILFKPVKAGEYPVTIALLSNYDVRLYRVNAVGLAAEKELNLEFSTVSGITMFSFQFLFWFVNLL